MDWPSHQLSARVPKPRGRNTQWRPFSQKLVSERPCLFYPCYNCSPLFLYFNCRWRDKGGWRGLSRNNHSFRSSYCRWEWTECLHFIKGVFTRILHSYDVSRAEGDCSCVPSPHGVCECKNVHSMAILLCTPAIQIAALPYILPFIVSFSNILFPSGI